MCIFKIGIIDDITASVSPEFNYGKILSNTEILINEIEECIKRNLSMKGSKTELRLTLTNHRVGSGDSQERVYIL